MSRKGLKKITCFDLKYGQVWKTEPYTPTKNSDEFPAPCPQNPDPLKSILQSTEDIKLLTGFHLPIQC